MVATVRATLSLAFATVWSTGQTVARYEQDMDAHRRAEAGWRQRRDELAGLLELARSARGDEIPDYANVKLRRGERVYCTVPGAQVELRNRQGTQYPTTVDTGSSRPMPVCSAPVWLDLALASRTASSTRFMSSPATS